MAPCKRKPVATARPLTEFFKTISKPLLAQVVNEPAGGVERPNKRARPVDDAEEAPSVLPNPPEFQRIGYSPFDDFTRRYPYRIQDAMDRTLPWEVQGSRTGHQLST
jgi:hypothetical protein